MDAHEGLGQLFTHVDMEALSISQKENWILEWEPIKESFSTVVRRWKCCPACGAEQEMEPAAFRMVSVPVVADLTQAIGDFFGGESSEMMFDCGDGPGRCGFSSDENVAVNLRFSVDSRPAVLCVQVKRYSYHAGGPRRDGSEVQVPGRLDFEGGAYVLSSFIEHIGQSARSGHYVSFYRCDSTWMRGDDRVCSPVSSDFAMLCAKGACIFFYVRL